METLQKYAATLLKYFPVGWKMRQAASAGSSSSRHQGGGWQRLRAVITGGGRRAHWGYSGELRARETLLAVFCNNLPTCLPIFTSPKYGQCRGCLHPACSSIARAHATARLCGPRLCRPAPAAPPRGPPRPAPAHPPRTGIQTGGRLQIRRGGDIHI